MKAILFHTNGDESELTGVETVETVNDIAMVDGIMHTGVEDVKIRA